MAIAPDLALSIGTKTPGSSQTKSCQTRISPFGSSAARCSHQHGCTRHQCQLIVAKIVTVVCRTPSSPVQVPE